MRENFQEKNGRFSPQAEMNRLLQGINTIRFLFRAEKNLARERLQAVFALAMASDLWQNRKFSEGSNFSRVSSSLSTNQELLLTPTLTNKVLICDTAR
ncbi:hypothetical protein [Fundidesulfovibrio soli]|uniref:hypothetical protein n=1 Tax=Fundidesulfovibrio soli TaxID=2922716 RepID=UPI001FB04110|nr:hypothetical protein [Fundidesulfovibrio soli]